MKRNSSDRNGATLLVTLGILTVLGILAVAFLTTSRIRQRAVASSRNEKSAQDAMDAGLHRAMRQLEYSLTYPNYTDKVIPGGAYLTSQRLVPVARWFSEEYIETNDVADNVLFQSGHVMLSPTEKGMEEQTVNLLTPDVLALIPSAATNDLPSTKATDSPMFRSGWLPLDEFDQSYPYEIQKQFRPSRVAFAIFDVSGLIDANAYLTGPARTKPVRTCFTQGDVTNWVNTAGAKERMAEASGFSFDPDANPFSAYSYDPDPNVYPLHYDCFETCTRLGRYTFGAGPALDLNVEGAYRALTALKEAATILKFDINSITNFLPVTDRTADELSTPWYNDGTFRTRWLDPVSFLVTMMAHEEPASTLHRLPDGNVLAWSIANFMDRDRIPQLSTFTSSEGGSGGGQELPTRVDYAVEDVPLINKVTVFNVYNENGSGRNDNAPQPPSYYDLPSSNQSNTYAVAVEVWYPFAPRSPFADDDGREILPACYVGIYSNESDVVTTTNQPWTASLLRDWFRWNYAETSNTVYQTLFKTWGRLYLNTVGAGVWTNVLWQTVNYRSDLWFTTSMTNHPYWPSAETNGTYDITATPIWQAFYPETYEEVVTNADATVTTNVWTTMTLTNNVLHWAAEDGTTNSLVSMFDGDAANLPWSIWGNSSGGFITNEWVGFTESTNTYIFADDLQLDTLLYDQTNFWIVAVTTNGAGESVYSTNAFDSLLFTERGGTNTWIVSTNALASTETVSRIPPLPMPSDLGTMLNALMYSLPTNSVDSLYTLLMLTPDEFGDGRWDGLFNSLSGMPNIMNQMLPAISKPTLGSLGIGERYELKDGPSEGGRDSCKIEYFDKTGGSPEEFQGIFWTIYPKQTVDFKEVTPETDSNGQPTGLMVTNYCAIGSKDDYRVWVRPVITLGDANGTGASEGALEGEPDIVDEALLTSGGEKVSVHAWGSLLNNEMGVLCALDPRRNAWENEWTNIVDTAFRWEEPYIATTNYSSVCELPFIQYDKPFSTIGDIGQVYASYNRDRNANRNVVRGERDYDTVTFSTRSGAALLDIFTVTPTNGPCRGLVQANTTHLPVLDLLTSSWRAGWTNELGGTSGAEIYFKDDAALRADWADAYVNAVTNAPYDMGWRSFADMLPALCCTTNEYALDHDLWRGKQLHPLHDYTEDAVRGVVDQLSFRQSVYQIVLAVQAMSPVSTDEHPVVLSEQRALVTVFRDTYTGRWTVADWRWLSR
jgi:hypothetical protein